MRPLAHALAHEAPTLTPLHARRAQSPGDGGAASAAAAASAALVRAVDAARAAGDVPSAAALAALEGAPSDFDDDSYDLADAEGDD